MKESFWIAAYMTGVVVLIAACIGALYWAMNVGGLWLFVPALPVTVFALFFLGNLWVDYTVKRSL